MPSSTKTAFDEYLSASSTTRSNLTRAIVSLSAQAVSDPASLDLTEISAITKLIDASAKLFAWPNSRPIDFTERLTALHHASIASTPLSNAVNLKLIATKPGELRQQNVAKLNDE